MKDHLDLPSPPTPQAALARALPDLPKGVAAPLLAWLERAGSQGDLSARVDLLDDLVTWLRGRGGFDLPPDAPVTGSSPSARLWVLLRLCETSLEARARLSRLVDGLLPPGATVNLLVHGGLAHDARLVGELGTRLIRGLLPQPQGDGDLAAMLPRLFPDQRATAWFEHAPPAVLQDLFALVVDEPVARRLQDDLVQAVGLLAARTGALGLDDDLRARGPATPPVDSPFLALPGAASQLARATRQRVGLAEAQRGFSAEVARAREVHALIARHIDRGGISVDLVFRVELLARTLHRLERLAWLLDRGPEDGPAAVRLLRDLVRANLSDRSLQVLLRENSILLARRIIERAGETGEHYITSSRAEWHGMLRSASGGGVLTAGTAMVKFLVSGAHLPAFFEFFACWVNYSGSFLVMQGLHFTLATKQPSMTAATIASELGERGALDGEERVAAITDLVARTARSQLAAALGNLGAVVPTVLLLDLGWKALVGHAWLPAEKAAYVVHSLHPWQSATIFYAALTAVILWLGSVLGGAVENWTALHRLPEAIAGHRGLRRLVGDARAASLSASFAHNISGVAGNVVLGLLLGAAPVAGVFFGLPLDVRHVTLSTGALALAASSRGVQALLTPDMGMAAIGILLVLLINFSVSFALALGVAARARGLPAALLLRAGRALLGRMLREPWQFVYPPPDPPRDPTAEPPAAAEDG